MGNPLRYGGGGILRYPENCQPQAEIFELFEALECDFALIYGVETALISGYGLSSFEDVGTKIQFRPKIQTIHCLGR